MNPHTISDISHLTKYLSFCSNFSFASGTVWEQDYSAPNKESTFSEILISAVKSTFSHSNHHKSIKELFWVSFLKICFSPYITHREAIEVQKQFLGKLSKFQQNELYLRICMELRFQIWSTHTIT